MRLFLRISCPAFALTFVVFAKESTPGQHLPLAPAVVLRNEGGMKALVTGGGGFLGRYVVAALLEEGWEVCAVGRSPQPDLQGPCLTFRRLDLAQHHELRQVAEGCDAIFHLAAKAGVWGRYRDYFAANVSGTRNVLAAAREAGVPRLIYTSTPSVVFNQQPLRGVDESQPYGRDWLCAYAETKAQAEQEVLAAHQPGTLATVALRPHLIWGKGDNHLLPRVIDRARRGRLRIVGQGNNRVDLVHVRNAAAAHLLAEKALRDPQHPAGGKAYFITQGEPVELWPWINRLLQELSLAPVTRKVPLPAAYAAGAVLEAVYRLFQIPGEPPMTRFLATELAKDHFFSIAAAQKDLGYQPTFSEEEGLAEFVADWKKEHIPA